MLHAKFQDHRFKGSTLYGGCGIFGHVTWAIYINFRPPPPFPRRLHVKFGFDCPCGFRAEDVLTYFGLRRTPEHWYTISSHCKPDRSVNLKMKVTFSGF